MTSHPSPPESDSKGAASEDPIPETNRFKSLAKGLFGVSRTDYAKAEKQYQGRKAKPS